MKQPTKTKPNLIKKNLFLDSATWNIAGANAQKNKTSIAEEIRFSLAEYYKQSKLNQKIHNSKWNELAGIIKTSPTSNADGAVNHNDIYNQ